jgi:hypothetical protein
MMPDSFVSEETFDPPNQRADFDLHLATVARLGAEIILARAKELS